MRIFRLRCGFGFIGCGEYFRTGPFGGSAGGLDGFSISVDFAVHVEIHDTIEASSLTNGAVDVKGLYRGAGKVQGHGRCCGIFPGSGQ